MSLFALNRFVGVILVNGMALHNEYLCLSGYCAQSVWRSDLSKWPGSTPESLISVVTALNRFVGVISVNGWLYSTSLCISMITDWEANRFVGVISVNCLALHQSLYLSHYRGQSVCGSDLSKWPGSTPESLYLSDYWGQSVCGRDLDNWPGSTPESLYLSGYCAQSVCGSDFSKWLALQHESLYLNDYWLGGQSVCGSDLSKLPGSAPVSVSQSLQRPIGLWEWSQ